MLKKALSEWELMVNASGTDEAVAVMALGLSNENMARYQDGALTIGDVLAS